MSEFGFQSGGGGGSGPASCCWIVQCGSGLTSTMRICATNTASGCYSTAFGSLNNASASYSTVSGGLFSTSSGIGSVVSGGLTHTASNCYSTISGGYRNTTSGAFSTISGGCCQVTSGIASFIGGGQINTSSGLRSTNGGGFKNLNNSFDGFIGGGNCNNVCNVTSGCLAYGAVVVGGVGNNTTGGTWTIASCCFSVAPTICNAGQYSFIGGGLQNRATALNSTTVGGINNTTRAIGGFIGGGNCNFVCNANTADGCLGYGSVVVGGVGNNTCGGTWSLASCCFSVAPTSNNTGVYSFIGGGFQNRNNAGLSSIVGGECNSVGFGSHQFIGGGFCNTTGNSSYYSTNSGGYKNFSNSFFSSIGGGGLNQIPCQSTSYSTIGGGNTNTILIGINNAYIDITTRYGMTIGGGQCNFMCDVACQLNGVGEYNAHHFIGGGYFNKIEGFYGYVNDACVQPNVLSGGSFNCVTSFVGSVCTLGAGNVIAGGYKNILNTISATISGGQCNTNTGCCATIGGGKRNTASECNSTVSGGYLNTASGISSFVAGGNSNTASCACSFIVGSCITSDRACTTFVNALSMKTIPTSTAGLPSGMVWRCTVDNILRIIP